MYLFIQSSDFLRLLYSMSFISCLDRFVLVLYYVRLALLICCSFRLLFIYYFKNFYAKCFTTLYQFLVECVFADLSLPIVSFSCAINVQHSSDFSKRIAFCSSLPTTAVFCKQKCIHRF